MTDLRAPSAERSDPRTGLRRAFGVLTAWVVLASTSTATAQTPSAPPSPLPATEPAAARDGAEILELERIHRESLATRRALADAVLVAGLGSAVGGGALIVPEAEDQAFRFAGINTAIFGVVNTGVALLALHGISNEEAAWESPESSAARRAPGGLARARVHAALDEHREATSHAVNLGLAAAYLGVAGSAILASRLGVEHPNRWLGSGVAIGVQALYLVGIDFIGLRRASYYHRTFLEGLAPSVAVVPSGASISPHFCVAGRF